VKQTAWGLLCAWKCWGEI